MKRLISILCALFLLFTMIMPMQLIASATDTINIGDDAIVMNDIEYKKIRTIRDYDFTNSGTAAGIGGSYGAGNKVVKSFTEFTGLEDTENHGNVLYVPQGETKTMVYANTTIREGVYVVGYDFYYKDYFRTGKGSFWSTKLNGAWSKERTRFTYDQGSLFDTYKGEQIASFEVNKWHSVYLALDLDNDTYTWIVDGEVVYTTPVIDSSGSAIEVNSISTVEGYLVAGSEGVAMDNFGVYVYEPVPFNAEIKGLDAAGNPQPVVNTTAGSKIAVKFSKPMKPDTFAGNITVKSAGDVEVAIKEIVPAEDFDSETLTLTITLNETLASGEDYNVVIGTGVMSQAELAYSEEQKYGFMALGTSGYEYGMVVSYDEAEKNIVICDVEGFNETFTYDGKMLVNGEYFDSVAPKTVIPTGAFVKYLANSGSVVKSIYFDDTPDVYSEIGYDESNLTFTGLDFDVSHLPLYNRTGELSYENDFEGSFSTPYLSRRYKYVLEVYDYGVNIKESVSLFKEYPVENLVISEKVNDDYTHNMTFTFDIEENPETLKYELYDEDEDLVANDGLSYADYHTEDGNKVVIYALPNVTTIYTLKVWVVDSEGELLSPVYENKFSLEKVLTPDDLIKVGNQLIVINDVEYQKTLDIRNYDFTNEGTAAGIGGSYGAGNKVVTSFTEFTGLEDTANHGDVLYVPSGEGKTMVYNSSTVNSGVFFIGYEFYYKDDQREKRGSFWAQKFNGAWASDRGRFQFGQGALWDTYKKGEDGDSYKIASFDVNKWHSMYLLLDIDSDTYTWIVDGVAAYITPVITSTGAPIEVNSIGTVEGYLVSGEGGVAMDNFITGKYLPRFSAEVKGVDTAGNLVKEMNHKKGSKIAVIFSVPMNEDAFEGNVVVLTAGGQEVKLESNFEYVNSEKKLLLTLAEDIQPSSAYTLILKASRVVDGKDVTGVCTSNNVGYDYDIKFSINTTVPVFGIERVRIGEITPGSTLSPAVYLRTSEAENSGLYLALYMDGKLVDLSTAVVNADDVKANYPMSLTVPVGGSKYEVKAFLLGADYEFLDALTVE